MENIKFITVDALIYLIALIKNLRETSSNLYSFAGNAPKENKCRQLFVESGFLAHVQSSNIKTEYNNNKIRIISGNTVDTMVIKEIIDFISTDGKITNIHLKVLYTIIGEMMNNAIRHAYDENKEYTQKWLLFVEKASDKYKFTLLDTGVTIPYTVNKKSIFENLKNDSSLVASALEGDTLRSRTGFAYRGKGLPDIRESVFCGFVDKMNIISRKACCQLIYGKNLINKSELGCPLRGTLYYWELLNKEVQNDIN